jgi:hypothetical protein
MRKCCGGFSDSRYYTRFATDGHALDSGKAMPGRLTSSTRTICCVRSSLRRIDDQRRGRGRPCLLRSPGIVLGLDLQNLGRLVAADGGDLALAGVDVDLWAAERRGERAV